MINKLNNEAIPSGSLILGEEQFYDMDCYKTKRNNNVLVVGAAGTGKTRSIVTPNILQAKGSYVISDPKGVLHEQYGGYLRKKGYKVRLLNFDNPCNSIKYNPFEYIRSEKDILKLAHVLVYKKDGTTAGASRGNSGGDPFWDRSAELLLVALIDYLWEFRPKMEQNIDSILKLIECGTMDSDSLDEVSVLDTLMEKYVEQPHPNSLACRSYKQFKVGAPRTKASILITLTSQLGKYNVESVKQMLKRDETNLREIGNEPTALFVQVSDTDRSLDDLANIFFTQAMNELCFVADNLMKDHRLRYDVRFIMDDFATNVCIHDFPRMISGIRSRGISVMMMIQAEAQLKAAFGDDAQTIIGNCDNYVFMGSNDLDDAKQVAERADVPVNRILNMPIETLWIFRRGEMPVNGRIFDIDEHKHHWLVSNDKYDKDAGKVLKYGRIS